MTIFEPELTFSDPVKELVKARYGEAKVILEYGSGGSTVLAAKRSGVTCFSVESDPDWMNNLDAWIETNCPGHDVHLHLADIGPVGEWGWPKRVSKTQIPRYSRYPNQVWSRHDFKEPDLVLIDGRFRVWCFLATLARIKRPTRVLFDDYVERKNYHIVERYVRPTQIVDRMAEFLVAPTKVPMLDWLRDGRTLLNPA